MSSFSFQELPHRPRQEKQIDSYKARNSPAKRSSVGEKRRSLYQACFSLDLISTLWFTPMTRLPLVSCLRREAVITALSSSLVTLCPPDGCLGLRFLHLLLCLPMCVCMCVCAYVYTCFYCIYVNQLSSFSGGCSVRKGYQNTTAHWEL